MSVDSTQYRSSCEYLIAAHGSHSPQEIAELGAEVYRRVCRIDFSAPGFCVIDLGADTSSIDMRKLMVAVKRELQSIHRSRSGRELLYLTAERFDQQQTSKFHLDGAPDESLLMLGYEPSEIVSEVALADYAHCAHEMGLSPNEFLEKHNPMFAPGAKLLQAYITRLDMFLNHNYQIVLINNSLAPFRDTNGGLQGVLHTATILTPDESKRRVINSTMIGVFSSGTAELISEIEQEVFTTTTLIRRKGYDKPHLVDDL